MCHKGSVKLITVDTETGVQDIGVDTCLTELIISLNRAGAYTHSCCCGHDEYPGCILLMDGTMIHLPMLRELHV
ncbi:MAG: hypothetical protein WC942_04910 [Clostridia bacterium]|jgi:hypothetical protein